MPRLIKSIITPSGVLTQATAEEARRAGANEADIDAALSDDALLELKAARTRRLDASDWSMLADAPLTAAQKTAWRDYRQALRNLPATVVAAQIDPATALNDPAIWPVAPT